jgi:copper chaperone CopZ
MKRIIMRTGAVLSLTFITQLAHAQMTITEYFPLKNEFKVDLNNVKNAKTIFTKGVLDVEWNPDKRTLAIAYDPKQTDIKAIVKNINNCAGESVVTTK